MRADLSIAEARRIALRAQGFGRSRSGGTPGKVSKLARQLGAFQIDSVNVLVRAHYVPAFSRLGPYPMTALDDLAYSKRDLFEYWGHAACLLPIEMFPLFRWRMDNQTKTRWWADATPAVKRYVELVYEQVASEGPLAAGELRGAGRSKGPWWGWSDGKRAIEMLFRMGRVCISGRRNFERLYDLTERVIPKRYLEAAAPSADDARKQLLVMAAKASGVGTAKDIAGYFHIDTWWDRTRAEGRAQPELPRLVSELVEEGRLEPVKVEGWKEQAYLVPGTRVPKATRARALVSPFDPLMWERKPVQRLFGFDYKIEIYVPKPKRVYGYYCLPFLLGDSFVARVDLKADRKQSTLRVESAHLEPGQEAAPVACELAEELADLARWLELDRITVGRRGNLARPLAKSVKVPG